MSAEESKTVRHWDCIQCNKCNHFKGNSVCQESKLSGEWKWPRITGSNIRVLNGQNKENVESPATKRTILFKINTGADVTVIPSELWKLTITVNELKQTEKRLTGPANNKFKCISCTYTKFQWSEKKSNETIYICMSKPN